MKILDLFSGTGGFSLGLERSGHFEVSAFCEIEDYAQRVLKKHWDKTPIYNDVRTLKHDGNIDVVTGGFPCQDISIGGSGEGLSGSRSGLWFEMQKVISNIRPKYVIVENVFTIVSRGLPTVLAGLAEIGYDATWTMFDTKYFGLPQRRRRIYIVGVRDGIPTDTDLFQFAGRNTSYHRQEVEAVEKSFEWNFEQSEDKQKRFAYFTRQRSDEFACAGVSSTLLKRDYKDFVDLVLQDGDLRRVTPQERMLLQGYPQDWLDDCGLTREQQFTCNGMSVPVIQHIGDCIHEFDRNVV